MSEHCNKFSIDDFASSPAPSRDRSLRRRIGEVFGTILRHMQENQRHRAARILLDHLSDRSLKDIGVSRSDIRAIAPGVFHDTPGERTGGRDNLHAISSIRSSNPDNGQQ